jgi:phosphoglycerate kinase
MRKKTVRDLDVDGKRVLVRVDYNVPLDPDSGRVLDDTRIRATLPTIEYLRGKGAKMVLSSHLGRPKGKREPSLSLWPAAERLSELLGSPVKTTGCCCGPVVQEMAHSLEAGEVLLLENVRFHPEEEKNDPEYAKALASLAEVYVNDAFGAAHRAHASTEGVARYLPAVAGLLMEKELEFLGRAMQDPQRPYAAIIGGAKVSTKMAVLESLLERVDKLLIGGGMANTFLKAEGLDVGESLVEDEFLDQARQVMAQAKERGVTLLLPTDVVVADRFAADAQAKRMSIREVPRGWRIMDAGETTLDEFARALEGCRTVVWNGPMGVIEFGSFAHGSHRLAAVVADLKDATTILGGGETVAVVEQLGIAERFSHVSTGGGASLEFLEGRELPGVAALSDA